MTSIRWQRENTHFEKEKKHLKKKPHLAASNQYHSFKSQMPAHLPQAKYSIKNNKELAQRN